VLYNWRIEAQRDTIGIRGLVNVGVICFIEELPGSLEWLRRGGILLILKSLPKKRKFEIIESCIT